MEETGKTLALLLVAAIVVSLGGTIISLNKIGQISITGKATSTKTGNVQLNITSDTSIAFTKSVVDFGNGYVNLSCNNCTMWSNSSSGASGSTDSACCEGGWDPLDSTAETGLWVQNQGNTNLTVNLNFSKDADSFLGGASPTPWFDYWIKSDDTARACTGGSCGTTGGTDSSPACGGNLENSTTWVTADVNDPTICASKGFIPDITEDEFVIDFRVRIPRTANPEQKTVDLTLTGTS